VKTTHGCQRTLVRASMSQRSRHERTVGRSTRSGSCPSRCTASRSATCQCMSAAARRGLPAPGISTPTRRPWSLKSRLTLGLTSTVVSTLGGMTVAGRPGPWRTGARRPSWFSGWCPRGTRSARPNST
jgi:hypothetical protein